MRVEASAVRLLECSPQQGESGAVLLPSCRLFAPDHIGEEATFTLRSGSTATVNSSASRIRSW